MCKLQNAVEAVWQEVKDMLKPQASKEERHAVLKFLQYLIKGQVLNFRSFIDNCDITQSIYIYIYMYIFIC